MSTDCLSNRSTWLVEQFLPGLGTPLESFGVAGRAVLRQHLLGLHRRHATKLSLVWRHV